MSIEQDLQDHGGKIAHHFGGGVYAKETHIPAGMVLSQHKHDFDHLSVLASGSALVEVNGCVTRHDGPDCITITAGNAHKITSITPVVWFCIHATQCTDESEIDTVLIQKEG